jgi:threonine/homoserine/homoserine lactone efflux protein
MLPPALHDPTLFVAAALLLNLTPGPDMLLVAGTAAAHGPRAGVWAALGVGLGCLFHMVLAALGVSALIAASPWAFAGLKALGGAYLVWMGWGLLRPAARKPPELSAALVEPVLQPVSMGAARAFGQGALTNALNPKVALFFMAFLPQFITPDQPGQTLAFVLLGVAFNVSGTLVNVAVALLSFRLGKRWQAGGAGQSGGVAARWVQRGAGALFVGLGLKLAFGSR